MPRSGLSKSDWEQQRGREKVCVRERGRWRRIERGSRNQWKIRGDNKWSERGSKRIWAEWRCVIRSRINLKAYFNETPAKALAEVEARRLGKYMFLVDVFQFLTLRLTPAFFRLLQFLDAQSDQPHSDLPLLSFLLVHFKMCSFPFPLWRSPERANSSFNDWLQINNDWVTFYIYWNHVCLGPQCAANKELISQSCFIHHSARQFYIKSQFYIFLRCDQNTSSIDICHCTDTRCVFHHKQQKSEAANSVFMCHLIQESTLLWIPPSPVIHIKKVHLQISMKRLKTHIPL